MTHSYMLQCTLCDTEIEDDGFLLKCPVHQESTLLTSHYLNTHFDPDTHANDITRYRSWLPCHGKIDGAGRTAIYKDTYLNRKIELPNLWIAFNGYWPERGATLETATFKELEAYTVLSRLPAQSDRVLVLASAGNTAAAFAHLCSKNKIRCLIVIPEKGGQRMVFSHPLDPCVKIVAVTGFSDYYDAIKLAERVSQREGFFYEGGVRNVGRRDGIGTTMLNAVEAIRQLPDYYFQAIGSGTGGIAVHEAAKRLIADGNFGKSFPRLMLSQNTPFAPMYHSWKAGQRALIAGDRDEVKRQIQQIAASVLSNQAPPYAIRGGVFDILQESQGDIFVANNNETSQAMQLFEEMQGIDIDPAAGVAFATLLKAATSGQVERDATILLHVTGGGWHRHQLEKKSQPARPDLEVEVLTAHTEKTIDTVVRLFG